VAILIDENTRFLIQGITGKQGQLACKEMMKYGSKVVAGVTPGKGGQNVDGVPIYDSVIEARKMTNVDVAVIIVPAKFAKSAIIEAIEAGIPLINVITENIPMHDMAYCIALAKRNNVKIVGGTSLGIMSIDKSKCGVIGGGRSKIAFSKGHIGVISRSGGMACETSLVLTQNGLGQSTVIGTGADVIMGLSFVDLIKEFENDEMTKGVVIFGEIGGTAEEDLAEFLLTRKNQGNPYQKPIVAFISGKFAEAYNLQNISLGHAGAIIEKNKGTRKNKVKVLKEAGVIISEKHHEIGKIMKQILSKG
jgi:succinyl-CoA synthetase alpha subunit